MTTVPAAPRVSASSWTGARWTRLFAVAATILVAMLGFAGPALAHNVLISSNPADGAVLDEAPENVSFTFDQPIENFNPELKVFGPDGNDFTTGEPTIMEGTISAPMDAGPAGDYRVVYRIVSADGHPVTGEIAFTLSDSAAGTATGAPASGASAPNETATGATTDSETASGGLGWLLWVGIGVAALVVVAAIVIALRPRRSR